MEEKDWFKYRGYPHIANKVPLAKREMVLRYVQNPNKIAKHAFLPLISKQLVQRRFKRFESFNSNVRAHYSIKNGKKVSSKKVRTIMYATHLDAHVFAYYNKEILEPKYEAILKSDPDLNQSVIAYRSLPLPDGKGNKNNIHFAKEVFDGIKDKGECTAILIDVENFFPTLNHRILKMGWASVIGFKSLPQDHYNIFKAATNYSFFKLASLKNSRGHFDEKRLSKIKNGGKDAYFETVKEFVDSGIEVYKNPTHGKGIPQGLPISALLANIYMLSFDKAIIARLVQEKGVLYRRYSDDMLFVCKCSQKDEVLRIVKEEIDRVELSISDDKTEIVEFQYENKHTQRVLQAYREIKGIWKPNRPMSYLGFEFYGYQTLIKSKNLASFYREMKQSVRRKSRRVETRKQNELVDNLPVFKRKIYRLYSYQGIKKRTLIGNNGVTNARQHERKYRGNFIRYAFKAAEILEAPEIKHQIKNHWNILQKTINKYNFSNGKVNPN
jgi:hypothetical protein